MAGLPKHLQIKPGDKIGLFTIIKKVGYQRYSSNIRPLWLVQCDCGKKIKVTNIEVKRRVYCNYKCKLNPIKKYHFNKYRKIQDEKNRTLAGVHGKQKKKTKKKL